MSSPRPSSSSPPPPSSPGSPNRSQLSSVSPSNTISNPIPTLEELVTHFVASKRSLVATTHVIRASEIVTQAREALEENAIAQARNVFLQRSVKETMVSLDAVRYGLEVVSGEGEEEFSTIVQDLDEADTQLKHTLTILHSTPVDPSIIPKTTEPKHLFDFVDEAGVEALHNDIRASIDAYKSAQNTLNAVLEEFDTALSSIEEALGSTSATSITSPSQSKDSQQEKHQPTTSPIPTQFLTLEHHATELAGLLQSLVRHYDLCLTALKHTEGGGEAVAEATTAAGAGELPSGLLGDLDNVPHQEPISESEKADMLAVLANDAGEVDDVIAEIRERAGEMEEVLASAMAYIEHLRGTSSQLRRSIKLAAEVMGRVPSFISAAETFLVNWETEKAALAAKMDELASLHDFYEGFVRAYEGLLAEVHRRKKSERAMEKVVKEAMGRLEEMAERDEEEREGFRRNFGEWLPSDIWPGLGDRAARWEVKKVERELEATEEEPEEEVVRSGQAEIGEAGYGKELEI
ncbi:APG17-domain-containing protein [Aulographum hederae CBS 113979]|uniref:Autophagy-related protein 17 n=1 Tax=Aulographum hederae CBS 113979 TaxID=1176131 RepID=A0A6G1H780_9PEZI|nr:APG17-domain-containing protein [Aulographum hederae CBS 113979]